MRSLAFILGLFVAVCGIGFLFGGAIVLAAPPASFSTPLLNGATTTWNEAGRASIHPPVWASLSLLGVGAMTMLYAAGLPRRVPPRTE